MNEPLYPSFKKIQELHWQQSPDQTAYDLIFTHCQIVWEIAYSIIESYDLKVDVELVKAGCLLHDIGTYQLYNDGWFDEVNYIKHGILGYTLLKDLGYDERLSRIASHHTGVGLSKRDIKDQALPLPYEDLLAECTEEELVMYADKFHSKHPRFNSYESYIRSVSQFGKHKAERFEQLASKFGIPDLEALAKKYNQPIV